MNWQITSAFTISPPGTEEIARNRYHRKKNGVRICYVAEAYSGCLGSTCALGCMKLTADQDIVFVSQVASFTMTRKYEPKHIVRNVFALTERIPLE